MLESMLQYLKHAAKNNHFYLMDLQKTTFDHLGLNICWGCMQRYNVKTQYENVLCENVKSQCFFYNMVAQVFVHATIFF